jgi:hypothetical protein
MESDYDDYNDYATNKRRHDDSFSIHAAPRLTCGGQKVIIASDFFGLVARILGYANV